MRERTTTLGRGADAKEYPISPSDLYDDENHHLPAGYAERLRALPRTAPWRL